jgi:hypothetical protein
MRRELAHSLVDAALVRASIDLATQPKVMIELAAISYVTVSYGDGTFANLSLRTLNQLYEPVA